MRRARRISRRTWHSPAYKYSLDAGWTHSRISGIAPRRAEKPPRPSQREIASARILGIMMVEDAGISGRRLTRLRTLGRGASGAVVSLFAAGDELLAVKSARGTAMAKQLRREAAILASLCSPHVLPCLGFRTAAGGEYQLILEFAPGGSLTDEVERNGGRLEEGVVRAYAADVARGLAYLHGEAMVHGDVKGRNVMIGADARAKLADFGCARSVDSVGPIGGTPAFMAPEVARGEEQGPAADVWALGCTVIEMATGRTPWSDMDDVVAAVRLIGYTDAVPRAPEWLSPEAKDFLEKCFRRRASERWTAAQLLEHPFLAFAGCGVKAEETKAKWVSPKSTLYAALWESDTEDEDEETPESTAGRIRALAGPCSTLPDWESDDGWIEVCSDFPDSPVAAPAEETTHYGGFWDEESQAELDAGPLGADLDGGDELVQNAGIADAFPDQHQEDIFSKFTSDPIVLRVDTSYEEIINSLPSSNRVCPPPSCGGSHRRLLDGPVVVVEEVRRRSIVATIALRATAQGHKLPKYFGGTAAWTASGAWCRAVAGAQLGRVRVEVAAVRPAWHEC